MRYLGTVALAIAVAILAGCGGGGGGTSAPPQTALTVIGDVPVPNVTGVTANNTAFSFDIAYTDQGQNTVYFTDRNNKGVDKITYAALPATFAGTLTAGGAFSGCNSAPGVPAPACNATAPPAVTNNGNTGPNGLIGLPGTPNLYAADVQKVVALTNAGALIANIPHTNPLDGNTGIRTDEGCILPAASSPIAGVAILAYSNNGEPSKTIGAQTRGRTYYTFTRLDTNAVIGQFVMPNSSGQEQCLFDTSGPVLTMLWNDDGDINNPNSIFGGASFNPDGALDQITVAGLITAFATAPVSAVNGNKFLILDTAANVTADIALGFYPAGSAAVPPGAIYTRLSGYNTSLIPPVAAGLGCTPTGLAFNNTTDAAVNCRPGAIGVPTNMMIFNRKVGGAPKAIVNAGGGDEVVFDLPTNAYYSAASRWTAGTVSPNSCSTAGGGTRLCSPVLQVVDATTFAVRARIPTGNNAHVVDVDHAAGLAFVPYSNASQPTGCLASACAAFPNGGVSVVKIR